MKPNNPITRRTFVKGVAATSMLASGIVTLNAKETLAVYDKKPVLEGTDFSLTIENTPVISQEHQQWQRQSMAS